MNAVGLGASSLSTIQSLISAMNSGWKAYNAEAQKSGAWFSSGSCYAVTQNGSNGIQQALSNAVQVVPMLSGFGGYAASYASQAASAIAKAQSDSAFNPTPPPGWSYWDNICVYGQFATDVGSAVNFANSAYSALLQQVQQAQSSNAQSLSIPNGESGSLTVAFLGWQWAGRPPAQIVQTILQTAGSSLSGVSLTVNSVTDTGQTDALGNAVYVANVTASGNFGGQPASKAGAAGAGYTVVICGTPQWCLGVVGYQPVIFGGPHTFPPITSPPVTTPVYGGPRTFPPITLPHPSGPGTPAPGGTLPPGTTLTPGPSFPGTLPPGITSPAPPTTSPPVGVTLTPAPPATTPPTGATPTPAGTSSSGKDLLVGTFVTAGLATVAAGVMLFAYWQRQQEERAKRR